ncbi:MAG: hypothetical protein ACO2PP_26710 [Thermocrinis sp.]|jgi:hypothetical protein|uniref:hypothetical protein n=1 Tax=Thermocrinis sp. TaxID=2024383 RepID=UPI003C0AD728
MLTELDAQIGDALQSLGLPILSKVDKPTELFAKPKITPCVWYIIEKARFESVSSFAFSVDFDVSVFLFYRSLREKGQGAYELLERILSALSLKTQFNLIPQGIELYYHESGEFAFLLSFKGNGRFVVPQEEEPLTTRITVYEGEEFVSEVSK